MTATETAPRAKRREHLNVPLAYLRTFIIVLVVAQHAAMPYNIIAPGPGASSMTEHLSSMYSISPVTDTVRSDTLSLLAAFNDAFMMALMFLLSGLFVWGSLRRKGTTTFLRDRLIRLGIPLVVMVLLRPLTYIPTFVLTGGSRGLSGFWAEWSTIEWRGGPIWFLEVLLLFNIVIVVAPSLWDRFKGSRGQVESSLPGQPFRLFLLVTVASAIAYIPISALYGSFLWLQVGPAQVQVNRVLFYAVYFLVGVAIGAYGIDRSCLVPDASLARRWAIWTVGALVAFAASLIASVAVGEGSPSVMGEALAGLLLAIACSAISFAFLALFLRFVRRQRPSLDSLFANSYGIYIVHYGVVGYVAWALLGTQVPAAAKWLVVFAVTLGVSWGVVAALRRVPAVSRVI